MKKIFFLSAVMIACAFTFKSKKFKGPEGYVYIPSGSLMIDSDTKFFCDAFWMSDHEVTNAEYREFLNDIKESDPEGYKKGLPDTLEWLKIGGYLDPIANMYFWHPAYSDYPVVNISKEGAQAYCEYMTLKYKSEYGDVIEDFRLPTRTEWMYAASSGQANLVYPWGGPYLRNAKGELLANYKVVGDHNITFKNGETIVVEDSLFREEFSTLSADLTAPSKSYSPNDFGLYNMSGNVAEMVDKEDIAVGGSWYSPGYDVRIQSTQKFEKANPYTGFRPVLIFINKQN
jgi:sulfatase modifying factor 1